MDRQGLTVGTKRLIVVAIGDICCNIGLVWLMLRGRDWRRARWRAELCRQAAGMRRGASRLREELAARKREAS